MAYTQFTEDMEILQKENDRPNALGNPKRSAADMKELFDEAGIKIKDYLNNTLLPELDNTAGDLVTDEAAIAQNATDIVALKAKKRFVYADADIAYNTTTTTSILKAKLHPSGEVGDYVIGKNGGVAVIVSQLDATRWNITTQQMSVRPPYSASQIGYSSQSEIYPTPPADVEDALAGLEGNVEGLINDVESLESSVTDLEARTNLVYYTGVIDTTKSTSTDQTGYLPNYKPNDDIIPGDCFIDDYGSIGVVTAISGTTVTYRYTGEKFNGLAENVLYGSLSPIYPAAPGNVSQALSGLEGVAETLVDDVGDLKAEASFVFFEGEIGTTSTVLSQYSTTSHFYPNVKAGCYFVDSKGAVGRVLGVSGTDVVFVFSGMRVLPTAPEFSSVTVQDSSGGVILDGTYIDGDPVLGLSETGDDDLPVRVMNVAAPTLGTDAANKAYVDKLKSQLSENTGNLVTLKASANVRDVMFTCAKPGFLDVSGTASSSGGRTVPISEPVTLQAGKYTFQSGQKLPTGLSIFLQNVSGSTILCTLNEASQSASLTVANAISVYIGANVTNQTTYNIANLVLQLKPGDGGIVMPTITANDYFARAEIDAMGAKVELIDDLSVNAYATLKGLFPFIVGGLTSSGATSSAKYRLASADRYYTGSPIYLNMPTGYKYAIFTFVGNVATDSGWLTGTHIIPAGTTFRLQLAKATEDTTETITVVTDSPLYINLTFRPVNDDDTSYNVRNLSVTKMNVSNPWTQGACRVGRKLVGFNASKSDHSANAMYRVYNLDDELTELGGGGHNLGHCATADYNDDTDTMIVANGTDESGISPAIYLIKNASAKISAGSDILMSSADVVEIPFASINGEGTGACFGENESIIYIVTLESSAQYDLYATKHVYRVLLGKGSTDLTSQYPASSFGTFISGCGDNEYNGTAYIMESYSLQMYGELQGMKYRNGYLFLSTDTPSINGTRTAYIAKLQVSDDVSAVAFYQIPTMTPTGVLASCEGEGIVFDGLYGYMSTFVGGVGTVYKFVTVI